ncbi:MAG TPA: chlorite dismutase family protein [Longimicrobiales bacterium]|nr:chlorite dismutase family protein [Longimicrobiales bacterium]
MEPVRHEPGAVDVRPHPPQRPALDEEALERIREEQERSLDRDLIRFAFLQVAPEWRRLPAGERAGQRTELADVVAEWRPRLGLYSYSLVGTRGDADLLLWQVTRDAELLHGFAAAVRRTALGAWLRTPYSYLGMTRRSTYSNRYEREHARAYGGADRLDRARVSVRPQGSRYLFVYPFVKTREWYALPHEERQRLMDGHIVAAHAWPDVKLNTIYSYGLDDQEFVMAFEADYLGRFVDLLMALRLTEASRFTLRDTPSFTCLSRSLEDCLEALG